MSNIRQGVTYADAETRGRLRMWKKKLAQNYTTFNNFFQQLQGGKLAYLAVDMVKGSGVKRRKAFNTINRNFGPGVTLESVDLKRGQALAIWSILKPRDAMTVIVGNIPVTNEASLFQDCVTVNYILIGTSLIQVCEGAWTLEVPDHALGRAVERSRLLQPEVLIREAHKNLLDLPDSVLFDTFKGGRNSPSTLIKAGAGCFAGHLCLANDISSNEIGAIVRVKTWLDEKQLHEDQKVLAEKGEPGKRLGDNVLKPHPLVYFHDMGDGTITAEVWTEDD